MNQVQMSGVRGLKSLVKRDSRQKVSMLTGWPVDIGLLLQYHRLILAKAMRWFPFLFMSLQQLFNVGVATKSRSRCTLPQGVLSLAVAGHSYVLRKLLLLMCPFLKRSQAGRRLDL